MKITISYLPEELDEVRVIRAFIVNYLPGTRTRMTANHAPYIHTYLTTKKPVKADKPKVYYG